MNCKGHHSTAYRGCPKYTEVKQNIKRSYAEHITYRDALNKNRQERAEAEKAKQSQTQSQADKSAAPPADTPISVSGPAMRAGPSRTVISQSRPARAKNTV